jgi:hypothetical protein
MGHLRLPSDILLRRVHHNWQPAQLMLTERWRPRTDSIVGTFINASFDLRRIETPAVADGSMEAKWKRMTLHKGSSY